MPHESPRMMTVPLMVLATFAALVGGVLALSHGFFHYMSHAPGLGGEPYEVLPAVMTIGTLLALLGVMVAWYFYVRQPSVPVRVALQFPRTYMASLHKFFFDEIYARLVVRPVQGLAADSAAFDKTIIDNAVDFVGRLPMYVGRWLRQWQSGLIQSYAAIMLMGVALMAVLVLFMS